MYPQPPHTGSIEMAEKIKSPWRGLRKEVGVARRFKEYFGNIDPRPVEARLHDHVILRWDPCHGDASATVL